MESVSTEKQLLLQVCDRLASGHLLGGAVRTEALFLAKTSGHEPHGQAEGPYSFLVETVSESDLFDVSHSRNGSWIFCPCQPAMSLGKGAFSTSPAGALDKTSTSFLIDSLQVMCCALGA